MQSSSPAQTTATSIGEKGPAGHGAHTPVGRTAHGAHEHGADVIVLMSLKQYWWAPSMVGAFDDDMEFPTPADSNYQPTSTHTSADAGSKHLHRNKAWMRPAYLGWSRMVGGTLGG